MVYSSADAYTYIYIVRFPRRSIGQNSLTELYKREWRTERERVYINAPSFDTPPFAACEIDSLLQSNSTKQAREAERGREKPAQKCTPSYISQRLT